MLMRILKYIANSTSLLVFVAAAEAVAVYIMNRRTHQVEYHSVGPPPDLWFGCTELKLHNYLASLGDGGRQKYLDMNDLDLLVYMWSYMILFGALLLRQCQKAQVSDSNAFIFPFAMAMDLMEAITFRCATKQYPVHLSTELVQMASIANQLKWIGLAAGLSLLLVLSVRNLYSGKELKSS